jgi:hypothetical protein
VAENAITWRLGVDKSQLTAGLKSAEAEALASSHKIAGAMGGAAEGGERIFTSSHRAANQVRILAQELMHGGSAADFFGAGLEAAERALRLPLGSLAALAAAGVVLKQLSDVSDADKKLKSQLATSLNPSWIQDYKASLETLAERYKETADKAAAARARIEAPGLWQKVFDSFGFGGGGMVPVGKMKGGESGAINKPIEEAEKAQAEAMGEIRDAQNKNRIRLELELNKIRESGVDVEKRSYETALAAAQAEKDALQKAFPKDDPQSSMLKFEAQSKIDILRAAKQQTEEQQKQKDLEDKQTAATKERFGMTLKELAEGRGGSPETEFQRRQARRAMDERSTSERLRLRGDEQGAQIRAGRATQIEAGIQGLKPSENMAQEVRAGVDAAQITQRIQELIVATHANAIT